METKSLLFGISGLLIGGLIVSIAAVNLNKPEPPDSTHAGMGSSLEGKTGDEFDKAFLQEMIAHHQGALDMAKLSETQAKHEEIKQMSKDIIAAQEKEIATMKSFQVQWGYAKSASPHSTH